MNLHVGDMLEVLPGLPEASVDAVVCDAPYELGILGSRWDSTGISFRPETWAEVLRVMKPGGYLAAMGAPRGWHRLACAIEDAGFDIRDSLAWNYGSGFPKSHNGPWGGSALKPAWEPIVLARRPLDGTHASNFERWGTGGLNVDEARVPLAGDMVEGGGRHPHINGGYCEPTAARGFKAGPRTRGTMRGGEKPWKQKPGNTAWFGSGTADPQEEEGNPLGRWPANVVHDGSAEVLAEFPDTTTGHGLRVDRKAYDGPGVGLNREGRANWFDGSSGSAARFFYCAKPSKSEKEGGLAGFTRDLKSAIKRKVEAGLTLNDSTCGYTCGGTTPRANIHPTAKPIELMRWLVRLLSRPGQTVLDPFLGSGTTAIACLLEGRAWLSAWSAKPSTRR